eukprot:scaffold67327_cov18-Tisochrysis_lutea.AAC.1
MLGGGCRGRGSLVTGLLGQIPLIPQWVASRPWRCSTSTALTTSAALAALQEHIGAHAHTNKLTQAVENCSKHA